MTHRAILLLLLLNVSNAFAAEKTVTFGVTGLFQPDRVGDLRRQAALIKDVTLKRVNYESAVVSFSYETNQPPFKNASAEQVFRHMNEQLQQVSKGAFSLRPLSQLPREQWREVSFPVQGLDCKACSFAAYNIVIAIDGVEHATASFKDGRITVWMDSKKTNREAVESALRRGGVKIVDTVEPKKN